MSETQGTYMVYKPTIWQRMGFGECAAPPLDDEDYPAMAVGRLITETVIHLSWQDRIRMLVSGKLMSCVSQKTDIGVTHCVSKASTSVLPPSFRMQKP